MDEIEEFVDERQKSWCIHCGNWIAGLDTNRDHVPSKSILLEPYPPNLPVVEVCKTCNSSFSLDEEYFIAFLSCVLAGTTEPNSQRVPRVRKALNRTPGLRARIEAARQPLETPGGGTRILWQPEIARIRKVILKNARGHVFFEYGEPMLSEPENIWVNALETLSPEQQTEFHNLDTGGMWPEVGSRMLTRTLTGQDLCDGWVVVQEGVYRYAVLQAEAFVVRSVLFEYLAAEVHWS